jgi:hypothetical protein
VRLIPDDPDHDDSEKAAIKTLFNHRLPKERSSAREEWLQIIEAEHALWRNISTAKKELVRSILNVVAYEIVKRRRPSSSFDFSGASIGNLFLTGYVHLLRYSIVIASVYTLYWFLVPSFLSLRLSRVLLRLLTYIVPLKS